MVKAKQRKKSCIHLLGVGVLFHMRDCIILSHILRKAPSKCCIDAVSEWMFLNAHSWLHLFGLLLLDNLARDGKSKTT
jgi:hypothetical protein